MSIFSSYLSTTAAATMAATIGATAAACIAKSIDIKKYLPEMSSPTKILESAVLSNNLFLARLAIVAGANVNAINSDGHTLLSLAYPKAYTQSNIDMMKFLIENGADINATDSNGYSLLRKSIEQGHRNVTSFLIKLGADVYSKDDKKPIFQPYQPAFAKPLPKGVTTPLHEACALGNSALVLNLIKEGADVHAKDASGETPLHKVELYNLATISTLIEHGADINAKKSDGNTLLHIALKDFDRKTASFFIRKGANVNAIDADGKTCFEIALENNTCKEEALEALCNTGPDVTKRYGKYKETLLHIAAEMNKVQVVRSLINVGANVNSINALGATPLYIASGHNHDTIPILLENGADPNAINSMTNMTPLQRAVLMGGEVEIVKTLLKAGAHRNIKIEGNNLLHLAAKGQHEELIIFLTNLGIDSCAVNDEGHTPFDLAVIAGVSEATKAVLSGIHSA